MANAQGAPQTQEPPTCSKSSGQSARAHAFTISEMILVVSARLNMLPANWHGLDIFRTSHAAHVLP